ncbi:MAG: GntR family transcriptional regulator [Thermotaleaceae bacterium]
MSKDIETIIFDRLKLDILQGKYGPNHRLPSENQLADAYRVPRIMIRKAFEKLEEMGYLYSKQGKGRFLKSRHQQLELLLSGKESFSQKMLEKGYDVESINIFCKKIDYEESIFQELGVGEKDRVFKIGRLRIVEKRPIAVHISYVAKSIFLDIEERGKEIVSMFEYYKSKGYKSFDSGKSVLSVSLPSLEEQTLLDCPPLIPLLVLETNCIDCISQRVLEYTQIIYRGDSFKYIVK